LLQNNKAMMAMAAGDIEIGSLKNSNFKKDNRTGNLFHSKLSFAVL